jgi:hypothetical protein
MLLSLLVSAYTYTVDCGYSLCYSIVLHILWIPTDCYIPIVYGPLSYQVRPVCQQLYKSGFPNVENIIPLCRDRRTSSLVGPIKNIPAQSHSSRQFLHSTQGASLNSQLRPTRTFPQPTHQHGGPTSRYTSTPLEAQRKKLTLCRPLT